MLLLVSRPATGSLRNTWITPATQWLAAVAGFCCLFLACAAVLGTLAGGSPIWWLGAAAALVLAIGALSVSALALDQRRPRRTPPR